MWQAWAVTFTMKEMEDMKELTEQALNLLDEHSKTRVQRFYRKEDSFRSLIGRLAPRLLLKEWNIPVDSMTFGIAPGGKPYMTVSELPEPIGYSITHDNGIVGMAYASGADLDQDGPSYKIGVDVMRLSIPARHTFRGFVEVFSEQLTEEERGILLWSPAESEHDRLLRFFSMWALKEAYSKSLGVGLGLNFKRISYDVVNATVRIDGVPPKGWEFTRFQLTIPESPEPESYVGFAVRYVPNSTQRPGRVLDAEQPSEWLRVINARDFLQTAVDELRTTLP